MGNTDAARWRALFERLPTAMAVVAADGRLSRVNGAFAALFARPVDELEGSLGRALLAPTTDLPEREAPRPELVTTCQRPDGTEFVVAVQAVRTEAKEVLVTVRPLSQQELDTRDLDRFFALSLDLVCIAGTDGYFKRISDSFVELLGWDEETLLSTPFLTFVHPDDRDATQGEVARLSDGEPTLDFENRYRCADGSWRTFGWRSRPLPAEGLIYAVARDVTAERRAQTELERSNQELERFAYVASHDLQEPLRMVVSYTELLAEAYEGKLDERADKYIRYAVEGGKRMQALIDGLLSYSRVHRRAKPKEWIDLHDAVRTARANLARRIAEEHAELTVGTLPSAYADPGQMVSLFQNLLSNALRFHAPGEAPRIEVGGEKTVAGVEIFVRDHGIGIEAAHRPQAFELFRRLNSRKDYEGTGIGLSIVQRIVDHHGGRVWIDDTEGGGATVRFTLPVPATEESP